MVGGLASGGVLAETAVSHDRLPEMTQIAVRVFEGRTMIPAYIGDSI
jgi:hypothetical protein